MKVFLTLATFILSISAFAISPALKDSPIDVKIIEALRQNVCQDVVNYAKDEGLKNYRLRHCLKNLEVSYVSEIYNVDAKAPAQYKIDLEDDYAKELMPTEQWIMCEVYMTEPLDPDNYEFSYCSIEG